MSEKFYPIIIEKNEGLFTASITELGIKTQSDNYNDALKNCISEKDRKIKILKDKNIPLPQILEETKFDLFRKKTIKVILFFIGKSVATALISIIVLLILLIMLSPYFKTYLDSPNGKDQLNKIFNKMGISFCINEKCRE